MTQISQRLKDLRLAKNLTHEGLAFAAGVSVATVQRAEAAAHVPSLQTLGRLARALGVQVSELIDDEPEVAS